MAEQMDASRDQAERSNNDSEKSQQPKAQENAQPKGVGLRNAIGKNKKVGENMATLASAAPEEKTAAPRATGKKEAQTLTKEKGEKKAKGKEEEKGKKEEEEEEEKADTQEVEALDSEEELAPNKISWQDLKDMLNAPTVMTGDFKTQANSNFFNTICPKSVAEKPTVMNLLKSIQALDLKYGADKSITGKQAALQEMIKNSNDILSVLNATLANGTISDEGQKKALQQYANSMQAFVATLQSKLQYNQEVWNFYANNELNMDAALFKDSAFFQAFSNFARMEKENNLLSAYMQAKKGAQPKKFLFKTLYKGVKASDKSTNEMLYKEKLRTGKKLQVKLPTEMISHLWSTYKTKKIGKFKSTLKKEGSVELMNQVQSLYNKFISSNITGDKI